MEIMIGKNVGFCAGVDFAIKQANELLNKGPIYCLGEIVHNKQVIQELESKGMITVHSIDEIPEGSSVIFRSHGEPLSTYQKAEAKNLKIEDLTCASVKVIHQKVQKEKEKAFILIVGLKEHPETVGTYGFAGENASIIETEDDILDAYMQYEKTGLENIFVISQTTFSSQKFDELAEEIEKNFCEVEVVIDKTICNSTQNRQLETIKIAQNSDVMLIIGGKKSSNTKKLFEIANQNCPKVYVIETVEDIKNMVFDEKYTIGIMAGSSTLQYVIEEVKKYLEEK